MLFTCAEAPEVFTGFGTGIRKKFYHNSANFEIGKRKNKQLLLKDYFLKHFYKTLHLVNICTFLVRNKYNVCM